MSLKSTSTKEILIQNVNPSLYKDSDNREVYSMQHYNYRYNIYNDDFVVLP